MADANPTGSGSSTSTSPGAATTRPVRRRKVRKGTQSCWECKRRKIRCTFASPGVHAVCDGCKSRGTRCVGQEYEDEPAPVTVAADRRADRPRLSRHESVQQDESQHTSDLNSTVTKHPVPDPSSSSSVALGLDARSSAELSRHLLSLWPSEPDVDRILAAQANTSFLLHGIVCQPYEGYFARHHGSWLRRSCLQRPADGTHPVLVARSMLMLVTLLDGLPAAGGGGGDDTAGEALKERLYSAAAKLVTANHELPPSLEGIESHLMEVMHLANRGNLRRAWLVNRRAVSLAQMMGLHAATTSGSSSRSSSSVAALHPSTRARVRPDYAWFRLVFTDRHLSLLLGLPQATTDNEAFAARGVLEAHPPLERFERVMGVACSLILQRNAVSASSSSGDLDTTYEIDRTLQRAAAPPPPIGSPATTRPPSPRPPG
ncbi:C6 zinc finger domain containing protein [Cordyceps fumosorosea ARSEF 2679]|uniref:C6 zinc finger domain containing protein n=1 Tax=Cordyceps fumosorosea (strain ARSEF 2679) TaxID=1081104 RepID=A0A168CDN1_CORFA|nr:C6 zinc finger domain containing protein [Cordyceps fumosorosea ARSEF 2679]OAA71258.1 C6 zinc finger domain containing protein [Cordyceps fumosorosea ARSEF 2679]